MAFRAVVTHGLAFSGRDILLYTAVPSRVKRKRQQLSVNSSFTSRACRKNKRRLLTGAAPLDRRVYFSRQLMLICLMFENDLED
jgi:hypothetical protein